MFDVYSTYPTIWTDLRGFEPAELRQICKDVIRHDASVDVYMQKYSPFDSLEHYRQIYRELTAREAGYTDYRAAYMSNDTQVVNEQDIVHIQYFNVHSPLAAALANHYQCDRLDLAQHVRSGYFDEASGNVYYVTGAGYDIIDRDLLGGNGSGSTRREFEDRYTVDRDIPHVQAAMQQPAPLKQDQQRKRARSR